MNPRWSSDFSYGYFRRILRVIKSNFQLHLISESPVILNMIGQPKLVLRHDIDVSPKRALRMAEIESGFDVCSTYMVITDSPLYCIEDEVQKKIFRRVIDMGHEIGLHFDLDDDERASNCGISAIEARIYSARRRLEDIIGLPVLSISLHRPIPQFLRGPMMVCGMVNAYSKELMTWYLSDSRGYWREGEPLPKLLEHDKPMLQLLIHPIWLGDKHLSAEARLQAFFDTEAKGQLPQHIEVFDSALADTIPAVRRTGLKHRGEKR